MGSRKILRSVSWRTPRLVDSHKGKQYVDLEKSCLAFNDDMADRLRIIQDSAKSKLCAILHNDNLQKAGVKGLHSLTTDKASDAMAFARKLRQVRSKLDTKLLFWQSGWQHNLKCVLVAAPVFSFGVVDPNIFKGGERGKIRHFLQHACELGKLYGLKLKTFSESRFEGSIDSGHELIKNPFVFLNLYQILKTKIKQNCPRILNTVKWNWALHVVEFFESPTKLAWVYAYILVAKNVFSKSFASRFHDKTTMHTSIKEVVAIFKRLKTLMSIARQSLDCAKTHIVDIFWKEHMDTVLHYPYKEYIEGSSRYGKCLHKWSRFSSCSNFALDDVYYCEKHYKVHSQFQQQGSVHSMNDYFPPHADTLYSRRLEKYGAFALQHTITRSERFISHEHAQK